MSDSPPTPMTCTSSTGGSLLSGLYDLRLYIVGWAKIEDEPVLLVLVLVGVGAKTGRR